MTLFQRLGGAAAVDAAVDIFYQRILADPLLAGFFSGVDMDKQIKKQKAFLTVAFGGAPRYDGRGLRSAHAASVERGLSDVHFDAVARHLRATLQQLGAAESDIEEVMAITESVRAEVLNR